MISDYLFKSKRRTEWYGLNMNSRQKVLALWKFLK